ncbi:MAG TPA: lysozyme inhibitor LprI family protein, partial [Burkholderiales bacterium]|nr:lysozyme inhibitor LprI family protein [Burkholderiales bacterium]
APIKCQSGTPKGELACLTPDLKELEVAVDRQLYQLGIKMRTSERTKGSIAARELRASQAPWLQYRNQFCIIEALASSGQSEWLNVRVAECKMRLTKDRLESLRDLEATLE